MAEALTGNKYYEQGNFDLETQEFSGTFSDPKYTGVAKSWHGLMTISLAPTQNSTDIAADDDPAYLTMQGALMYEGQVSVVGMKLSEYENFFNIQKDKNGMVLIGSRKLPKEVGIAFKNTGGTEVGLVTNKFVLFRCVVTLPSITTASIDADGNTIREFTMDVKAKPIQYKNEEGAVDSVTLGCFDSETNKTIWDKIKTGLFLPDATIEP